MGKQLKLGTVERAFLRLAVCWLGNSAVDRSWSRHPIWIGLRGNMVSNGATLHIILTHTCTYISYGNTYMNDTYTYIHIYIHIQGCCRGVAGVLQGRCTHTYTYKWYIQIHAYTCTYIHIHMIYTHTYIYIHLHIYTNDTYKYTDDTYKYIHIHTHTYTLYNAWVTLKLKKLHPHPVYTHYMLSKLVMLRAQAAVSSTCGGMPGHWSPV